MKIPGLIDLQVNGYMGVDFSGRDLTEQDFARACREIMQSGTTAFLPTIITSPREVYERNLPIMAKVMDTEEFRHRLLGVHIEGPFISPVDGVRGAHNDAWIRKPDIRFMEELLELADEKIKLLTIAAETDGAEELTRWAIQKGITVSLGHQTALSDDLARLSSAGARSLTHLGNGIQAELPRHENPIWSGLGNDDLWAMIITDGHHLPPALIKTVIRVKGPSRCVVVSDASPIAGMPAGQYHVLGDEAVLEECGHLYNPRTGYLVGSSATILECMNYLASLKLLTLKQLLDVGFYNPLKLINVNPKAIQPGVEIIFEEETNLFIMPKP